MKKRELTDEERDAWLEETGQKSKAESKPTPKKKSGEPAPAKSKKNLAPAAPLALSDLKGFDKKRVATRPDATLDLHGLTQDKAHARVVSFIKRAAAEGNYNLLIITGKGRLGTGVLRNAVPKWLDTPQLRPFILAITYANPKEGGEGAIRVLLRKR
jgi:DNA-nicking Smr family endonuclease